MKHELANCTCNLRNHSKWLLTGEPRTWERSSCSVASQLGFLCSKKLLKDSLPPSGSSQQGSSWDTLLFWITHKRAWIVSLTQKYPNMISFWTPSCVCVCVLKSWSLFLGLCWSPAPPQDFWVFFLSGWLEASFCGFSASLPPTWFLFDYPVHHQVSWDFSPLIPSALCMSLLFPLHSL